MELARSDKQRIINEIIAVKNLLSDETKWTQGHMAEDKHGESVASDDENAVCWCLSGALQKVRTDYTDDYTVYHWLHDCIPMFVKIRFDLGITCRVINVWNFNDLEVMKYSDIIAFLDYCKSKMEDQNANVD